MRKHFLILMLMALLPFTAWAEGEYIVLTPRTLTKAYGTADAAIQITAAKVGIDLTGAGGGVTQAQVLTALNTTGIVRVNSVAGTPDGEDVGIYTYTFPSVITVNSVDYEVVTNQNGTLNIIKKDVAINPTYAKEYDGNAMGSIMVNDENAGACANGFPKATWDEWSDVGLTLSAAGTHANAKDYVDGGYASTVTATISDAAKAHYNLTVTPGTLTINPREIDGANSNVTVTVNPESANSITTLPVVTVKFGNTTLTKGADKDYTYQWSYGGNNIEEAVASFANAGTYTVTVTGKGNFSNTKTATFKINGASLAGTVITLEDAAEEYVYDGVAKTPSIVSVKVGNETYTTSSATSINDLFVIAYDDNTDAGTHAKVTITGKDNTLYFNQTATKEFTIAQFDLAGQGNNVTIDAIAAQSYNTKAQTPAPTVKKAGTPIPEKVNIGTGEAPVWKYNWTVSYSNNTNATSGTSLATVTVTGTGNYKGQKTASFEISPKDISTLAESDFAAYDAVTYSGEKYTPATTGKVKYTHTAASGSDPAQFVTLEEGQDYTVTYGTSANNINAGVNAGIVTYTGKGNYTGTKTVNFTINQKALKITAKSYTINYGTTRPDYEVDYEGLVANDLEADGITPKAGVFNTPVVVTQCTYGTTTANDNTNAGTYSLVPSAAAADNYSIAPADFVPGTLIINANLVTIRVKAKTVPYGTAEPTYTITAPATDGTIESNDASFNDFFELEIVGDASTDIATLTSGQVFTFTREKAATKTVGTYNITVTGSATLAGGYQATYLPGTLTIERLKLRAVAQNKEISWHGGEPEMAAGYDALNNPANIKLQKYTNNSGVAADLVDFTPLTANYAGVQNPQTVADVVSKIEWVNEAGEPYTSDWEKGHPGTIKVTLLTDLSAYTQNYEIQGIDGAVSFSGIDVTSLDLAAATDKLAAIQDADNITYNTVKVSTDRSGVREIEAQQWNTYILPFDITVAEISSMAGIGYAVVNVIDGEKSSAGNVKFKIWMGEIKANTPFAMKTLENLPGNYKLSFSNKKIVAPTNQDGSVVVDIPNTTSKFIGTYAGHNITNDDLSEVYCFNGGWHTAAGTYPVKPFEAYLKHADAGAHFVTFEEADGSTTAIQIVAAGAKAIAADGWYTLNGVKLQGAPTEKGVYINNGKKVVIK